MQEGMQKQNLSLKCLWTCTKSEWVIASARKQVQLRIKKPERSNGLHKRKWPTARQLYNTSGTHWHHPTPMNRNSTITDQQDGRSKLC